MFAQDDAGDRSRMVRKRRGRDRHLRVSREAFVPMHAAWRGRHPRPQRRPHGIYIRGVFGDRNVCFVIVSRAYYSVIYRAS